MSARAKPESCSGCQCVGHGTDFSAIEGTGSSRILIVGEASGSHEQRDQLPFRPWAPAGGVLQRVFDRMGKPRSSFAITNCQRCRPRGDWLSESPWEHAALNHCRANLKAAIAQFQPSVIWTLGNIAMREVTGFSGVAKEMQSITHVAGYCVPSAPDLSLKAIPVVPGFHPSHLRRGKMAYFAQLCRTLQRALNIAAGKDRDYFWDVNPEDRSTYAPLEYSTHPSLDEALSFARLVEDGSGLVVSYDLETFESASLDEDAREGFADTQPRLIQFCVAPGRAIAFPWEGRYREVAQRILHSPNVKVGHNTWLFDQKVLRAVGEREGMDLTPRGVIHDTLQEFHHWQPDLPAHLQFCAQFVSFPFPWKHLASSDIEFYGCCDVDATLRLHSFLETALKKDGTWGDETLGYLGQVYSVRPVLAAMEDRGMPIDNSARLALDEEFDIAQRALGIELAQLAPASCKRVHPKIGYVGTPPEVKKWYAEQAAAMPDNYAVVTLKPEAIFNILFTESGDDGESYHYALREFAVPSADAATGELVSVPTVRWCRVYEFNPNSKDQVIAYMKAKGHRVPKSKEEDDEGNQKDTTAEKELRRLAVRTGDNFYLKVIEYRGFTKLRSTYIDGFVPHADGCVHTTFTFAPAIGQLSSRSPNVQNFLKLKPTPELAKAMRRMVAAKPGNILTEWDFRSCHVQTLGFLAEDDQYMRLGRLDIHSFVAGHFLGLWDGLKIVNETDDELLARFKWLKSNPEWKRVRDDQAKHGILGIGNGLQAKGLFERYMESFPPTTCRAGCVRAQFKDSFVYMVKGVRGMKKCPECGGMGQQSGQKAADGVLEVAGILFPKIRPYQDSERKEAHEAQRLATPFGYARRFYEVYRWDAKRGSWGHGDQAEEAVAYRLANIAFGHIREKLKELHRAGADERWGLFNNVHDSFMFHFENMAGALDDHIAEVYPILTTPSTVLKHPTICPDGLVIDVEGSWGYNWKDMVSIELKRRTDETHSHSSIGA